MDGVDEGVDGGNDAWKDDSSTSESWQCRRWCREAGKGDQGRVENEGVSLEW